MTLNITYEVTVKSEVAVTDDPKRSSNTDSLQHVSKYSNNTIPNVTTKRLDLSISPTTITTSNNGVIIGDSSREITINLEDLGVSYIQIIHIKSLKYFMYKFGSSTEDLNTKSYEQAKVFFRDFGDEVSPENYTPPTPPPKLIRFLNPANLNGGGDPNNKTIGMITISLLLITSQL